MSESASGANRFFSLDRFLLGLLLFVPAALLMELALGMHGTPVFIASAVAIIPLAGYMGRATERLAEHLEAGRAGAGNGRGGGRV